MIPPLSSLGHLFHCNLHRSGISSMGRRGPQPKSGRSQPPPPPKPQGEKTKRTPTSAFDPAAGGDIYEPEKVVAQRLAKGITQFHIKWKGYDTKDNTWEPIENLAGCEDMIAEFKEREKTRIAQVEAAAQAKYEKKQEEAAAEAAKAAEMAASARVAAAAAAGGNGAVNDAATTPADTSAPPTATEAVAAVAVVEKGAKRTSPVWTVFDETGAPLDKACCKLLKSDGTVCGEAITTKGGPQAMKTHVMYKHPADYIKLGLGASSTEKGQMSVDSQTKMPALPAKLRDEIHKAHARWLCKNKRPLILTEDKEYHDVWKVALKGAYVPPDHKINYSNMLVLSGEGKQKLYDVNTKLRKEGIKPAMAGDIWSSGGISLLGLCEYYMSEEWTIQQLVLAAAPFAEVRHTGEAIDLKTRKSCVEAGLSHDVFSSVFFPVSDNASNMKNGWASFGRGPCCVHTVQLSVKVYLNDSSIKPMRDKEHGIVAHFSHATGVDGLGAFHRCQRECHLPEHEFVKDNDTRWSSGHDQMEFFRVQQRAVQTFDVNCSRKASDAYKQYQMGLEDWRINMESVAVLQPIADWTQHLQGTKYPTLPLVLPTIYSLIEGCGPTVPLSCNFDGQQAFELTPDEMHPGVLQARTEMYDDFVSRWITNINPEVKRTYAIATLLHPCFKTYDFIDGFDLIPQSDKAWALRELRTEWATNWKSKHVEPTPDGATPDSGPSTSAAAAPVAVPAAAPVAADTQPTKKRKVFLGGLLAKHIKKEDAPSKQPKERDELEEYLEDLEEPELDEDILKWWKAKESRWPALAKMVKQYFAASCLVSRSPACLFRRREDAWRPSQEDQPDHIGALTLCCI